MAILNKKRYIVRTFGDEVLKAVAAPVLEITPEIRELAEEMRQSVRLFNGVGLAAPQVGRSLRMVVFDVPEDSMGDSPSPGELALLPRMPLVVINPEIVGVSDQLIERDEGCLSVPEIYAPVIRPATVVFQAATLDGERIHCECGGLLGRCIQHELDHLDGKLFIDRLTPNARSIVQHDLDKLHRYGERHSFRIAKVR